MRRGASGEGWLAHGSADRAGGEVATDCSLAVHRGGLLERHSHLRLPLPYKATGAASPFQRECQRKAIRHYTWSDHVQCSARLGELADQAQDRTSVKFDHPGFEYLIPGLVPFCDVSHGDVPPCSDPQRAYIGCSNCGTIAARSNAILGFIWK